jgi:hypothetical protein
MHQSCAGIIPAKPTYTFIYNISLPLGRDNNVLNGKILYKGISHSQKKTQRTIPSEQLPIVRLENKYNHHENNNFWVSNQTASSTQVHLQQSHSCTEIGYPPPPDKGFSDYKDFIQFAQKRCSSVFYCTGGWLKCLTF